MRDTGAVKTRHQIKGCDIHNNINEKDKSKKKLEREGEEKKTNKRKSQKIHRKRPHEQVDSEI